MTTMAIITLVLKYGSTLVLLFPMVWIVIRINDLRDDVREIKDNMVGKSKCNSTHESVNDDLKRLKDKVFNG